MRIRTYYRGPDAVVTSELFVWNTSPAKTFVIRELKNVVIARGGGIRNQAYATPIAVAISPTLDGPVVAVAVLVGIAAMSGVAIAVFGRRSWWELHATYRNAAVLLYASKDERVFNQVGRALRRAMEDADPHTRWNGAAA